MRLQGLTLKRRSDLEPEILVDGEVYSPSDDSFLLEDNLCINEGSYVLDIGTGTGILAIKAALLGARRVIAVDINLFALRCTSRNSELNGSAGQIAELGGDLFKPFREDVLFDVILFNPPYLQTKSSEYQRGWLEKAWAGGPTGRAVIDLFVDELPRHLRHGGMAFLLHPSYGVKTTIKKLKRFGMDVRIIAKKRLFFEQILALSIGFSGTDGSELLDKGD